MIRSGTGAITGSCRMFWTIRCLLLAALISEQGACWGLEEPGQGPVLWTGNTTVVSTSRELVAALSSAANRTRSIVQIGNPGSQAGLVNITLNESDLTTRPISLQPGANITVTSAPGVQAALQFGGLVSVILVGPKSRLDFKDLFISGWALPRVLPPDYPFPASPLVSAWPTLAVLPGAEVSSTNITAVSLYDSCKNFTSAETVQQLQQLYGPQSTSVQNGSLTILGTHSKSVPLYNFTTKVKEGEALVTVTDSTGVCKEDPAPPAPAGAPAAGPTSGSGPLLGPDAQMQSQNWSGYKLQDGAQWAVSVTNSSDLALALQNGQVENIAIADPLNPKKAGHIVMQNSDWGMGQRPVSIQPGRSVTITSASSEPAVLDFNNLVSAISVTANATLTLETLSLMNLASHHAADSPDYSFNRVRELQIWPSIALEAGSEVVAYNLSLTAPQDNCTEFMATSFRQAQMLFGPDSVTKIGTNGAHYTGALLFSNVTLIDPSSGSAAGTMGVYFQNFTRYCTDDTWGKGVNAQSGPAVDFAPAPDNAFIPRLGPRTRLAASSAELAALLRDPSIDGIRLISTNGGPVNISLKTVDFAGALGPVAVQTGRKVNIQPASPTVRGQVNFNGMAPAIIVSPGAELVLENLDLAGLASPKSYNYTYYPLFLGMWPTIAAQRGGEVHLINTTSFLAGRTCAAIKNTTYPNTQQMYGSENVVQPTPYSISVLDNHTLALPINDYISGSDNVATFDLTFDNTTAVCMPFLVPPAPPPPPPDAAAPAAMLDAASEGGSNAGLIGGIVGGVLAAVAISAGIVGYLLWRRRRRQEEEVKALEAAKVPSSHTPSPPNSGNTTASENAMTGTSSGLRRKGSTEFHEWPKEQLQKLRLGLPEEESLEQGPLLGRGGFGKVYKGRWKGVIVAIKVVEHSTSTRKESLSTAKQRIDRESVLSTQLSHPNVITTFKICTIKSDRGTALDSAQHAAGRRPQLAADENADPLEIPWETDGVADRAMLETWLILEFCDRGNLADAIQKGRLKLRGSEMPDLPAILRCLVDIAAGMEYLHCAGVLHGDLKTANVLLKSTGSDSRGFQCKLADFGLSRIIDLETRTHVSTNTFGTITYMPPELLTLGHLTKAADVYSLGIIMSELYSMQVPFEGLQLGQITVRVVQHNERPEVPDHCPPEYRALMEACWDKDAYKRPTFPHILETLLKQLKTQEQLQKQQRASAAQA